MKASKYSDPGAAPELRDIGAIVGADWRHGSRAASDVLIDVLSNINLLSNQFGPSQFAINGERYSATVGPQGPMDVRLIHHPRAGGINEAGPSQPLYRPPQIVRAAPPDEGTVDLSYLIRGRWAHRERFLPDYLVRALEGPRLMPEVGRPTYFEIRGVPCRGELVESEGRQRVRAFRMLAEEHVLLDDFAAVQRLGVVPQGTMITQGRRMAPGKQQAVNLEESVPAPQVWGAETWLLIPTTLHIDALANQELARTPGVSRG
ncbi:hypothetical protein ACM43_11270 [Bradyrhizobium sp. CCBAU 45321]|uniref:Uncharacterized protein n=1 Tax=Bradyrhizobium yuanmingense TaxID=108015 RepID=A0A1C3XH86_9BRAD|nr:MULTISPECIES: hypothetical protein [Bradyrhizobium]MDA9545036.1 hypothetical protein [Bradyrhizobium sp. CCBAU 45321]TWI18310.1 hypothetical protein IQ15_07199 [Bradyrhizobium yuanmingense]SCB51631.1 hypothetical protein GA0061099_102027 [Bradyrhizobium yuanmingense]